MRISQGGENHPMYGKHHTEETKKKLSETLSKRIITDEHKANISKASKGRIFSKEHKNNIKKNHAPVDGENNGNAKLTKENVIEIRQLLKNNITVTKIAKMFNVTKTAIIYIRDGKSWKSVK